MFNKNPYERNCQIFILGVFWSFASWMSNWTSLCLILSASTFQISTLCVELLSIAVTELFHLPILTCILPTAPGILRSVKCVVIWYPENMQRSTFWVPMHRYTNLSLLFKFCEIYKGAGHPGDCVYNMEILHKLHTWLWRMNRILYWKLKEWQSPLKD